MACGGEAGMEAWRAGEPAPVGTPLLPKPAPSFPHRGSASGPNHRPDFEQLREERQVQRLLQEAHAAGTAGAGAEADDPHHRAHVAEAPRLELAFQVHQVFAQRVLAPVGGGVLVRSEEHTSELQSLMRISYAVFCLKKKNQQK